MDVCPRRLKHSLSTTIICVYVLLLLGSSETIQAHSDLIATFPNQGEVLTETPSEIRLQFDEALGAGSTVVLFAENFQQISADVQIDPSTQSDLVVPLNEKLPNGIYTVQWLVISSDGHQLSGSYQFQIIGENRMELVAEGTAVNLPGWFAWLMVILALGTPGAVWAWAKNSR